MNKESIIQTDRLILRQWQDEDLEPFTRLNTDPRVRELSRQESDASVKLATDHIQRCGWGFWAASLIQTDEFIGFIGLEDVHCSAPFVLLKLVGESL